MRIKSVSLHNFKGITEDHHLSPITIITGDNCSGKTAVAMAIKLGLAGTLPVIGKSAQSVYRLAGNPDEAGEMAVTLQTDPAGVIQHTWTRNAKGTVSYAGALPPGLAWPEAMLDFRRFLSLSGAEQAAEIFARCKTTATANDFMDTLDGVTGTRPEVVREAVQEFRDHCTAPLPLAGWISNSLDWVKKQVSSATQDEKRASSALQLHVKNQPSRAEDVSEKLAEAEKELQKATEAIAKHANAWRRYERELAQWSVSNTNWAAEKQMLDRQFEIGMAALRERLNKTKRMDCCPTCGAKGVGWSAQMMDEVNGLILQKERDYKAGVVAHQNSKPKGDKPSKPEETPKAAQERIVELQAVVNDLRSKQTYFDGMNDWKRRRDNLEIEAGVASCRLAAFKEIAKRLGAWRDAQINGGIGEVLAVANKFADGLLFSPIEWHPERAEFGRRRCDRDGCNDGAWISLDAFSGFEEQLAFAALSVAVASQTKVKVVIMDEMGRLVQDRKIKVIRRMRELVKAGVIDQFIGIDVDAATWEKFSRESDVAMINL